MMNVVRKEDEVNTLLDRCMMAEETGNSEYPGMSYEQGIKAGIEWLTSRKADHPLE